MKYDSEEKTIKNALNTIKTPQFNIRLEVEKKIKTSKTFMGFKRPILAAIMACLFFVFSTGVAAVTIPSFNKLLAIVSPNIASILQPINVRSEDNGIKMEVVAAMNDDEMAVIYVTMQDLTDDRIDESIDLYDYSLTGTKLFNSQVAHYDGTTKTATLRIVANGGEKLNNKLVSFDIDSFLSDKQIFNAVETGINLLDVEKTGDSQIIPLDMNNISGGGGNLFSELRKQGTINILKTDQMKISFPELDFMYISNIGYIEDRLHIQIKWVGDGVDDHGYFYFIDTQGDKIDINESSIYFGTDEAGNAQNGREYIEYIFDVDDINLHEVKLMGYFVTNGNYTIGQWRSTFKLQPVEEEKQREGNIKFAGWITNVISVSPMGITLVGNGEANDLDQISISANMTDGSTQTFDSVRSYNDDKNIKVKFTSSLPLDVSKVESVSINGNVVKFD